MTSAENRSPHPNLSSPTTADFGEEGPEKAVTLSSSNLDVPVHPGYLALLAEICMDSSLLSRERLSWRKRR